MAGCVRLAAVLLIVLTTPLLDVLLVVATVGVTCIGGACMGGACTDAEGACVDDICVDATLGNVPTLGKVACVLSVPVDVLNVDEDVLKAGFACALETSDAEVADALEFAGFVLAAGDVFPKKLLSKDDPVVGNAPCPGICDVKPFTKLAVDGNAEPFVGSAFCMPVKTPDIFPDIFAEGIVGNPEFPPLKVSNGVGIGPPVTPGTCGGKGIPVCGLTSGTAY